MKMQNKPKAWRQHGVDTLIGGTVVNLKGRFARIAKTRQPVFRPVASNLAAAMVKRFGLCVKLDALVAAGA